jgi:hypothetical protein
MGRASYRAAHRLRRQARCGSAATPSRAHVMGDSDRGGALAGLQAAAVNHRAAMPNPEKGRADRVLEGHEGARGLGQRQDRDHAAACPVKARPMAVITIGVLPCVRLAISAQRALPRPVPGIGGSGLRRCDPGRPCRVGGL